MTTAIPSEKPRTTGLAMYWAMRPSLRMPHTINSSPPINTIAAESVSACAAGTPVMECNAAASTAAEDEVAATIA